MEAVISIRLWEASFFFFFLLLNMTNQATGVDLASDINLENTITLYHPYLSTGSLVAQMVKSLPAVWETCVRSMGHEDPLEKEMANHSSILA